jgi:hypothetical protein
MLDARQFEKEGGRNEYQRRRPDETLRRDVKRMAEFYHLPSNHWDQPSPMRNACNVSPGAATYKM